MSKFFPTASPRYFAPATFRQLQEGGALKEFDFDCEFKRCKKSEIKDLDASTAKWREQGLDVDAQLIARVCTAWRIKVPKADGAPGEETTLVPFSEATMNELEEDYPGFIGACVRAFYLSGTPAKAAHLAEKN
jgi:hypothetical protein